MIVSSKFRCRVGTVSEIGSRDALGPADARALRSIIVKSTAAKLNGDGMAASDRVHLREIAVIFAPSGASAARKRAKNGWQARHTVACRREVTPI
jgi:hypothetical protein